MSKEQRLAYSVIITIFIGGLNAYTTAHRNSIDYQEHPIASIIGAVIISPLAGLIFYWTSSFYSKRNGNKSSKTDDSQINRVDDKFYDQVAYELQEKNVVPGLWTKAYAEANGDDAKTRAFYIKYRVCQLQANANENDYPTMQKRVQDKPPKIEPVKKSNFKPEWVVWAIITFIVFFIFSILLQVVLASIFHHIETSQ